MKSLDGTTTSRSFKLGWPTWASLVLLYLSFAFNIIAAQHAYDAQRSATSPFPTAANGGFSCLSSKN